MRLPVGARSIALGCAIAASAHAADPSVRNEYFEMDLPGDFQEPVVARMSTGITFLYQRPHPDSKQRTQLQISIVEIPAWSREASITDPVIALDHCLDMFLHEVSQTQTAFGKDVPASGELDSKPMRKARWIGKSENTHTTGILECALSGNYYYVVHIQDAVRAAPSSFVSLRDSIRSLRFRR
ncbi:MAG: hypothetical protein IT494_07525 [Gammaproteobacteria bacterium]|nr:hypothetical protein [Gammaproteobacteria bacterium]